MAKKPKLSVQDKRLDSYCELIGKMLSGDVEPLAAELDAAHGFMAMWSQDYNKEGDPRMSMISMMVGDLFAILSLVIRLKGPTPAPTAPPAE